MSKGRKLLLTAALLMVCLVLALPLTLMKPSTRFAEDERYLYLYPGQTEKNVRQQLNQLGVRNLGGFALLSWVLDYHVRPGRYAIHRGDGIVTIFRRLRNGQQEPLMLTIPSVRTMDRLAGYLSHHLMLDSVSICTEWTDSLYLSRYELTPQTLPSLFIPNTYQVYWTTSLDDFMQRMQREHKAFWNDERERKAQALGMTHTEVATLASIVDEETANNAEKPMVAGMYLNRLHVDMLLQADPTVKFALGDFSLRRIYQKHLTIDSPYNTYRYAGLPPGPIRIASVAGIDAVLNRVPHEYLYMCAKEDFSGTHNFARTYAEHLQNARRYTQALNQRNIK